MIETIGQQPAKTIVELEQLNQELLDLLLARDAEIRMLNEQVRILQDEIIGSAYVAAETKLGLEIMGTMTPRQM